MECQVFRPTRRGGAWRCVALGVLALLPGLLSGCGGGTTSTSQGFRIVPAGGPVAPISGVLLSTQPGVVGAGVAVTAARIDPATLPTPLPPQSVAAPGGAYKFTLSPAKPQINQPITISLSYSALPSGVTDPKTLRIYTFDGSQWVVLPLASPIVAGSGVVVATLTTTAHPNQFSDSGIYAIFGSVPPGTPST